MYPKERTEIVNMQLFVFLFFPLRFFLPKIFEENNSRVHEGTENGATERK